MIHAYIRVFKQPALCRFAQESLPGETGNGRHWTPVFFCGCASNAPRFAQGQPNGYFQMKELDRTTEPIARMNVEWKLEKAEFAEFNLPTCGNIAVWQLCGERQPLWNSHDGLNLTCLDQCHGVSSHGTSSSEGWCKIIVIRHSNNDPWVYIRVFNQPDLCRNAKKNLLAETGLCRPQASAKIRARPAQGLFSNERTS